MEIYIILGVVLFLFIDAIILVKLLSKKMSKNLEDFEKNNK